MVAEVAEREAPEVDYSRIKRWVIKRNGKDYVQYAGLLDLLHQESEGAFEIVTRLEQAPTDENRQTAIVSAVVTMAGRTASGLGDANPGNVSEAMAPHLVRMAETRAKGRALRDLLNIGLVTVDELGAGDEGARSGGGAAPRPVAPRPASFSPPVGPRAAETFMVDGKAYSRAQIEAGYRHLEAQAKAAGVVSGEVDVVPLAETPTPIIYAKGQELKRRLEARASAK